MDVRTERYRPRVSVRKCRSPTGPSGLHLRNGEQDRWTVARAALEMQGVDVIPGASSRDTCGRGVKHSLGLTAFTRTLSTNARSRYRSAGSCGAQRSEPLREMLRGMLRQLTHSRGDWSVCDPNTPVEQRKPPEFGAAMADWMRTLWQRCRVC